MADNNSGFNLASAIPVVGNLVNGILQSGQNKKNRKFQAQENQKARDFNLEMWNKQNAYNDPTQQMMRLKNAGINPHLAYSEGSPMNTSNAPASSNASNLPAGIAPQMDINGVLQARLLEAQINKTNAEAEKTKTDTEGSEILNGINSNVLKTQLDTIALNQALTASQINVNGKNIEVSDQNIKESNQRIVNLISQDKEIEQRIINLQTQNKLTETQISEVLAKISVAHATIKNIQSSTILNNEKSKSERSWRSNIEADTRYKNEQSKALSRSNYIGEKFDLNNADSQSKITRQTLEQIKQQTKNSILDGELKNVVKDKALLDLVIDGALAPATITEGYLDVFNPLKSSTTTRFNANGDYSGHSTTRRHR